MEDQRAEVGEIGKGRAIIPTNSLRALQEEG